MYSDVIFLIICTRKSKSHFHVFKNRNAKYQHISREFNKKPSFFAVLILKMCRKGETYTTEIINRIVFKIVGI